MDDVLKTAADLNRQLLASEVYCVYCEAKAALEKRPEYQQMVDNFRRRQVELEARKINGEIIDSGVEFALSSEYADICLIETCNDFFQAEMKMLELIKRTYAAIFSNVKIDMDFMN